MHKKTWVSPHPPLVAKAKVVDSTMTHVVALQKMHIFAPAMKKVIRQMRVSLQLHWRLKIRRGLVLWNRGWRCRCLAYGVTSDINYLSIYIYT